ncbi:hypothetical protein GFY24_20640 [Nocardia sp. SYP-A9097]|nr:hypothetical protein [Nocardia sp. SYP-A9097]
MFERFTDHARRAVVLAQDEGKLLNHDYIGTEHLLLGILREGEGVAARVLADLAVDLKEVRDRVETIIGRGAHEPSGHVPFTPRAKQVLQLSLEQSIQLGHREIGTEHLLLALIVEGQGVAAQVLNAMDVHTAAVRARVLELHTPAVDSAAARPVRGPSLIEQRIAALERRVTELEQRLAGGRDEG